MNWLFVVLNWLIHVEMMCFTKDWTFKVGNASFCYGSLLGHWSNMAEITVESIQIRIWSLTPRIGTCEGMYVCDIL